ncbi:MAG: hypothetical protein LC119_16310 [Burkholderiales bacterium]|nr:hypothetical protein [Burkholderiales bacterium]
MDSADDDMAGRNPWPDLDTLVAGTVALMTAWADPCPQWHLGKTDLRRVLARKVVANLTVLQHHPQARPELRQSLAKAHARWVGLARHGPTPGCPAARPDERVVLH